LTTGIGLIYLCFQLFFLYSFYLSLYSSKHMNLLLKCLSLSILCKRETYEGIVVGLYKMWGSFGIFLIFVEHSDFGQNRTKIGSM
jgi:hypothetical protein